MTAGVCRWMLECAEPAVVVIEHRTGRVAACAEHAAEHQTYQERVATGRWLNLTEPDPECWCPDAYLSNGNAAPYCPLDGTPEERGIDPLDDGCE